MRHQGRVLGAAATGSILAAILPAAAATHAAPAAGRCASPATVVAHHAGGRVVHPQPRHRPRACGATTGYPAAESHLVVRRDGAVVFTPAVLPSGLLGTGTAPVDQNAQSQSNASPGALIVTRDHGGHWQVVKPSGATWNPTDHSEYVDPASGRLFFEDYGPIPLDPSLGAQQEGPAHINWTDDLRHWHHIVVSGLTLPENPRFTSGRPPAGAAKPTGYPSVLYFCANTNVGFVSPVIAGRVCFRSLDGGDTWNRAALLFTGTVPQHSECTGPEVYSAIDGYYPQAAPDGSLYVMVACGGTTYLARSTDEAATFPLVRGQKGPVTLPVPTPGPGDVGGSPELRITDDGTFLLAYQQGNHLMLRLSSNHGVSWGPALDATAPGVTAINQWSFAASGHGDVAWGYLGRRAGQTGWDGYVTSVRHVQQAVQAPGRTLFLSARVNPANRPLLYGDSVQGSGYFTGPGDTPVPIPPPFNQQVFRKDFIGAAVAPDGTAWASFTQDCGPSYDSPGCVKQHDQTRAYAGYVAWS